MGASVKLHIVWCNTPLLSHFLSPSQKSCLQSWNPQVIWSFGVLDMRLASMCWDGPILGLGRVLILETRPFWCVFISLNFILTVKSTSNVGSSTRSRVQLVIRLLVECLSIMLMLIHLKIKLIIYLLTAAKNSYKTKIILRGLFEIGVRGKRPRLITQTLLYKWMCEENDAIACILIGF